MRQHLNLDWIDAILIALGFSLGIQLSLWIPSLYSFGSEISMAAVFMTPALRRAVFGAPNLSPPKKGAIWTFCSIFGLLMVFLSTPFLGLGAMAIHQSKESIPDFRSEVLEEESEWAERFQEIDSFLNSVVVPAGTPQEEIDRLTAENKAQREKEKNQKTEERILEKEKAFLSSKERRFQDGVQLSLWGLGICCLGSFLLRIRHPFERAQK